MMGSTEEEEEKEEDFDDVDVNGFELPGNSCLREAFAEIMML